MSTDKPQEYFVGLVRALRKLPAETGWLESRQGEAHPESIGGSLSAVSHDVALNCKANAYLVWGIHL
jgi:ATP-dependent DNA helicase RecG